MTRTKKALVTVALAAAAAIGTSAPAFANVHATDTPVTTDNIHATDTPVTTDNIHAT
ncbi:hypothetical protein [Streptomyces sp. GbtcB7]|uniref:hypothetical protein n=1 Tax=Streptomyces sp. GbtcB7 TaxID=2824752 RepID=UPI001C30BF1E|nr:hypothetical protein [Streptomyces sp. GbtcB7]